MRLKMSVERESDQVRRRNYPYTWGYMHNFASPKKSKEGEKNHAHSIDENFSHRNCVADKKMWDSAEGHYVTHRVFPTNIRFLQRCLFTAVGRKSRIVSLAFHTGSEET